MRARRTTGDFDSVPFFRRAIELDPEFALAYARLGTVYGNLRQTGEARTMTERAYELRAKTSEAERLYIEARYHTTVGQDVERALETYGLLLGTYPDDYTALVNSGMLLNQTGRRDAAITRLTRAVEVAPEQPVTWGNLGSALIAAGRLDEARRAFESAIGIVDTTMARMGLFVTAVLSGDEALADAQVQAVSGRRDEVDFLAARVQAAAYHGRMSAVNTLAGEWTERMIQASRGGQTVEVILSLAISEASVGLADRARARLASARERGLPPEGLDEQLALAAIVEDARMAREVAGKVIAEAGADPRQAGELKVYEAMVRLARAKARRGHRVAAGDAALREPRRHCTAARPGMPAREPLRRGGRRLRSDADRTHAGNAQRAARRGHRVAGARARGSGPHRRRAQGLRAVLQSLEARRRRRAAARAGARGVRETRDVGRNRKRQPRRHEGHEGTPRVLINRPSCSSCPSWLPFRYPCLQ